MLQARRILLGAFGDPGHAFPMIALGRALVSRGHEVTMQTWKRWRSAVEAEGMRFAPAPEYDAFPAPARSGRSGSDPLDFYEAVIYATRDTSPLVRDLAPALVVSDILTLAPALAAEREGIPSATLIPHVFPESEDGFPIYSFGAMLPRTPLGRAMWRGAQLPVRRGLEQGRRALNQTRAAVGLPPLERFHGGTSSELALVGTFPALEYPRQWPAHVHVVGPLMWEPPAQEAQAPPGERPLVLIAPSTSQDPEHKLLAAALKGLSRLPVRVLATWNGRLPPRGIAVPDNARLLEWLSYSKTMPACDVVVCHAGHGTLARALAAGCVVVACPVAGDMNENAARIAWAGAGLRLPSRFIRPRPLQLAVERALSDETMAGRARQFADWLADRDPALEAATLIERLARRSARAGDRSPRPSARLSARPLPQA